MGGRGCSGWELEFEEHFNRHSRGSGYPLSPLREGWMGVTLEIISLFSQRIGLAGYRTITCVGTNRNIGDRGCSGWELEFEEHFNRHSRGGGNLLSPFGVGRMEVLLEIISLFSHRIGLAGFRTITS
jgi:hypothetical protein